MIAQILFSLSAAALLLSSPAIGAKAAPHKSSLPLNIGCPAEQLSCGKQKPVLSDGVHPFENHEMGVSAIFPRGSLVCQGRSGDAPRGFYAWLDRPTSCAERKSDQPTAYLGIYASWNSLDWTLPRQTFAYLRCRSHPSLSVARRVRAAFPRRKFEVCQRKTSRGIELTLIALAGRGCERVPAIEYVLTFGTTWRRFATDMRSFETFLRQAKIGSVSADCGQ